MRNEFETPVSKALDARRSSEHFKIMCLYHRKNGVFITNINPLCCFVVCLQNHKKLINAAHFGHHLESINTHTHTQTGRVMTQVFRYRPFAVEGRVQSQANPCRTCGRQADSETAFLLVIQGLSVSSKPTYSSTHSPPTLH